MRGRINKVILREPTENEAFYAIASMQGGRVFEITAEIANHQLPCRHDYVGLGHCLPFEKSLGCDLSSNLDL